MSVRIYQLSKELEMSNKEVIALLNERGLDVKSASNTIPNIYAESILEEFKKAPEAKDNNTEASDVKTSPEEDAPKTEVKSEPTKPKLPAGKIIKSAEDIIKEKEAAKEAEKAKNAPPPPPTTAKSLSEPAKPKSPPAPSVPSKSPSSPPPPPTLPPKNSPKPPSLPPKPAPQATTPPPPPSRPTAPVTPKPIKVDIPVSAPSGELKPLQCKPPIVVRDFAIQLGLKPFKLISELMEVGIFASMNQSIDEEVAVKLAQKHGFKLEVIHRGEQNEPKQKSKEAPKVDESKLLEPRPPVVCVLGHVDHGKTTLLDTIRKANVVSGEAGGITQHIGAYQVSHNNQKITFIDTPGHAAFSKMRERGANITDIAILVVAADDAFKPQTEEALKFAQKANVPIVVAINKIDSKGANIDRVKQQLQERNLTPEDWGGETLCAAVSALKGTHIEDLLELLLLQSEMQELKANPKCPAEGVIIESQIEVGRGSTATVIIQKGTLKVGDALVCGTQYCKVRAMMDDKGKRLKSAPPSTPVSLLGWSGAPESGSTFTVVKNEREAKRIAEDNAHQAKMQNIAGDAEATPADLENLLSAIASAQEKSFKAIIKGDVHGTVEALVACLEDIKSDKIKFEAIYSDVGQVSKNDVQSAHTSGATIIAFNTRVDSAAQALAKSLGVTIVNNNIIYELIDQVKESMADLLEPELREEKLGAAEVRQVFAVSKGAVAGCMVTEGRITRDAYVRVIRGKSDDFIFEGKLNTLKRFKEDASEVRAGYECGIQIAGFTSFKEGDLLEAFKITKIRPAL